MGKYKNVALVLGVAAGMNLGAAVVKEIKQTKPDQIKTEIFHALKAENNHARVISRDGDKTTPIEELDETEGENAGYPLGTVIIKDVTRDNIMQQLSEKYAELYQADKVLLELNALNSLDTLIQSGELKPGMRVGFKTENKAMKSFYIYKEPSREHIKRFEIKGE